MRDLTAGADAEAAVREVYLAHFGTLAGWATQLVGDRDLGPTWPRTRSCGC